MLGFPGCSFDDITTYFENPFKNYHNIYGKNKQAENDPIPMVWKILNPDFRFIRHHCFPVPWDREDQNFSLETVPIISIVVLY